MRKAYLVLCILLVIGCIIFLWPAFEVQVALLLLCAALVFFVLAVCISSKHILFSVTKYVSLTLFSLFFALAVLEGYYYIALGKYKNNIEFEVIQEADASNQYGKVRARRLIQSSGEVLYDVVYTRDAEKRRITPVMSRATTAVVFLGCSFTFGDGLEDQETFPWQVAQKLGEKYQVFNYGISGFGAHDVLAVLEGDLSRLQAFERILFFYTAIEDHQRRLVVGPRYVLENGLPVRQGSYPPSPIAFSSGQGDDSWRGRSYLFRKLYAALFEQISPLPQREDRVALLRALIVQMDRLVQQKFPHASFTVLAWPPDAYALSQDLPVTTLDVEKWLPDYASEQHKAESKYILRPSVDTHPTAYACSLVADALAKRIKTRAHE